MDRGGRRAAIVGAVEGATAALTDLFEREATRFFTENDLVCGFHRLLTEALSGIGEGTVPDLDGRPHGLVHCEYPTPFRCDMGGGRFEVKADDVRTPGGGKYRRGRFDVAVLDPWFVGSYRYAAVKGQDYTAFRSAVASRMAAADPIVLYGVEFVFCRDEIKPSKGEEWQQAANRFVAGVRQDAAKLTAAVATPGYMLRAVLLAFVKGTTDRVLGPIRRGLDGLPMVRLVTAN